MQFWNCSLFFYLFITTETMFQAPQLCSRKIFFLFPASLPAAASLTDPQQFTLWNQVALSTLSTQTRVWFWTPEAYQPGLSTFRTVPWKARDRGGRGPELPGWADGWRMRRGCAAHGRQRGVRPEPGRHCQSQSRPAALQPALQVPLWCTVQHGPKSYKDTRP